MERFMKQLNEGELKVYLIVNENGQAENVYATVGMALDAITYQAYRVKEAEIKSLSRTKIVWVGRDDKEHSREIKECLICKDVTLDYMNHPRAFVL